MARAANRVTAGVLIAAGTVALAWSGAIHLRLWSDGYESIAWIGPLFLAQGIVSLLLAVALAVFRRLALMAAGAVTLAGTAAGLLLSAYVGLFGYTESLAVPYAAQSLYVEFAGAAALAGAGALTTLASRGGGGGG